MPGASRRVPGCLDGLEPLERRPFEVPPMQRDSEGFLYSEEKDPDTFYRAWRSLQPAAWLPDGLYDSVGDAILADSDEWWS